MTVLTGPAPAALRMPAVEPRRWPLLGGVLMAAALAALVGATLLMAYFGWPDVLEEGGASALRAFAADESLVRGSFYLLLVSSLLLIPAAIGLEQALARPSAAVRTFTVFGVLGAAFQLLGWVRWPVTVPGLAERYADPAADEAARAATVAAYDVLNGYAGAALGEHLGWLLQAPWAVAVPVLALHAAGVPRWFAWIGVVAAAGWAPLVVLQVPWPALADGLGAAAGNGLYTVWFVWLGVLGGLVATRRVGPVSR